MPKLLETVNAYVGSREFTSPPVDDALPPGFSSTLEEADSCWPAEMLRQSLIARLRKFAYPQPEGRRSEKKQKTFYERVKAARIIDSLLNGELFWTIRLWMVLLTASEMEKDLRDENFSPYYCPIPFHREMIEALIANIAKIQELLRRHEVGKEWASECLAALDAQLVREVRGIFLYYPGSPPTEKVVSSPRDYQVEIHDAFLRALENAHVTKGKQNLAIQLTSLVCSPLNCIDTRRLDPSPDAIRKKIEAEKNKLRHS